MEVIVDTVSIRIKRSSHDRFKTVCEEHKLTLLDIIDLASFALSSGIININTIKDVKDQVLNKAIEVALKKEQSLKPSTEQEPAGMSYSKTGWANARPEPIKAKTYSMMEGQKK
jgi:hypothetical protein